MLPVFRRAHIVCRCAESLLLVLLLGAILIHVAPAQTDADITVHLAVRSTTGKRLVPSTNSPVVVWLSPIGAGGQADLSLKPGTGKSFQMVQKDKMFQPHLLVVPTGSVVAFPNRDPFFHNVFSLFNGRRFDLGLYEIGNSHSFPFTREGISYIFCNIHPDMGAVIVSVATPYFVVANQESVQLRQVPPGDYLLKVWAEDATAASIEKASRRITIGADNYDAGVVNIVLQPRQMHTDKFGKPYSQHPEGAPY
ncbi:cupredoxin domain-containing protein [Granulicella arctica]|uniref:Plastocyanin n=1 Tax=Granulicella arctica TaxID=940613 RepID=A0A7Y9TJ09_9BACT|nr:hypothetical protein [Granulicella arctica]NYF77802.1 plastocyanin [Granulicella arctica]